MVCPWYWLSSIIQSVDGGYVFLARTTTVDGEVMGIHLSRKLFNQKDSVYFDSTSDIWVVKLLQTGEIEWQKCLGGYDEEFPSEIIQTSDSGYVILGSTYSNNDGDVSGYHGGGDLWVVKLGGAVNSVNSYSPSNNSPYREFNIFPNPSNDIVNLQLYSLQTAKKVLFYDMLGREYTPPYQLSENTATVNVKSLPPGAYVVKLEYSYNTYIGSYTLPLLVLH